MNVGWYQWNGGTRSVLKLVSIQVVTLILVISDISAQSPEWDKLEKLCQEAEVENAKMVDFFIAEQREEGVTIEYSFDKANADISQDGRYIPGLPKVSVSTEVLKNRVLPSPSRAEDKKYEQQLEYLKKLYVLSCKWNQSQRDDQLAQKIMNSLDWYLTEYAPERPYWRLTFRFGQYEGGGQNYPILPMIDRVMMNMMPVRNTGKIPTKQESLFYKLIDYTDHLVDQAVGAQNRGVNWTLRFNQLFFHYMVKYRLLGKSAIYQLREHFYDGFEYDPNCHISEGMGTLADGGFWHHGRAPYCLPYGTGDYRQSTTYLKYVEGTPMEFEPVHYKTYEDQLLKKWQYVIYNDEWFDLAIVGGKNACQTVKTKAKVDPGTLMEFTDRLLVLKKENLNSYDEIANLKKALANKTHESSVSINADYWQWEYMLHRRPGWYIGFKGLSEETATSEWDQCFHLSSGHTSILRRGDEYWSVRNALRWTALPGITAEQLPYQQLLQQKSEGSFAYCNGSSDGKYGLFAFDMGHENTTVGTVTAKKAAFFFDEGVVNLTNDIKRIDAGAGQEIWTSLDNRQFKGNIIANINGKNVKLSWKELPHDQSFTLTQTSWVWHDSIAYVIPVVEGGQVTIRLIAEQRTGNVKDVLPHNPDKNFSHKTFLLAINHGTNPTNASAMYFALPGVTAEDMSAARAGTSYQVLANDAKVQAVYDRENQILEFAFRANDNLQVPGFGTITSFGPVVGTMRKVDGKLVVSLANPFKSKLSNDTQLEGNPALSIAIDKKLSGENVRYDETQKVSIISLEVTNKAGFEGQPMIAEIKL